MTVLSHFCPKHIVLSKSAVPRLISVRISFPGSERLVLNMCEKQELNFDETLHLVFKNYSQNVKKCECWVNKGPFSPIIMDLRLNSRYQDMCSASKLFINTDEYTCDPQSDSYGAIFGQVPNGDLLKDAFISLANNLDIEPPEMVWIAIIPEGKHIFSESRNRVSVSNNDNNLTSDIRIGFVRNIV